MSWTLDLFCSYRRQMGPLSLLRYRNAVLREKRKTGHPRNLLCLPLRGVGGQRVWLREGSSDLETLKEVILDEVYKPVVARTHDCRYILDIGANIGLTSIFFASAYPDSSIVAVEPHPESFVLLERNVRKLVGVGRCRLVRRALWSHDGDVTLVQPRDGFQYDSVRVTDEPCSDCLLVRGLTMPQLLSYSGFPRVDLLKIDIEGAEVHLFRSNLGWLRFVRAIAIEFHDSSRHDCAFDEAMRQHGFQIDASNRHTVVAIKE